jgi:hypothetical protein
MSVLLPMAKGKDLKNLNHPCLLHEKDIYAKDAEGKDRRDLLRITEERTRFDVFARSSAKLSEHILADH